MLIGSVIDAASSYFSRGTAAAASNELQPRRYN